MSHHVPQDIVVDESRYTQWNQQYPNRQDCLFQEVLLILVELWQQLVCAEKSQVGLQLDNEVGRDRLFRVAADPNGIANIEQEQEQSQQEGLVDGPLLVIEHVIEEEQQ